MNIIGKFIDPAIVSSHFHFREGDYVADFGAGSGFFLKYLSEQVGDSGRVYACEIQKQLIEKMEELVRLGGLSNVSTIWCDLEEDEGIKLQRSSLDAGILVNVLFQLVERETALREMRRVIKMDGILHIIDWSTAYAGVGPSQSNFVSKEKAIPLIEGAGFSLEREYVAGAHHYGLAFRKI